MRLFGRERKNDGGNQDEFCPREDELEFVTPFIKNREIPFVVVQELITQNQQIPEERRMLLSDWLRNQRAKSVGNGPDKI